MIFVLLKTSRSKSNKAKRHKKANKFFLGFSACFITAISFADILKSGSFEINKLDFAPNYLQDFSQNTNYSNNKKELKLIYSFDKTNNDYIDFKIPEKIYNTEELLLAFYVNKIPRNHVDIVIKKNNSLYLNKESIDKLNLNISLKNPIRYYDKTYYPIPNKDIKYSIRAATSILDIYAPPELFNQTIIEPEQLWHYPDTPGTGGYINYDLLYKYTHDPKSHGLDSIVNTTLFHKQNILTSDFRANIDTKDDNKTLTRLETKFIRDFPDNIYTLTLGDTRTYADLWGNPVLVGGLQIATNFSLQPGFIYYPLPDITGKASIPSAIDLYINDTNRQRKNIQEGPFEIRDIPTINGRGEITVIQQDLLGREKSYTVPYYMSSFALKPGIKQYSVTAGLLRKEFGLASNKYSNLVITGNYKQGITKFFTYSMRGEVKEKQIALGTRGTFVAPEFGEISLLAVGSAQNNTMSGSGGLFKVIYMNQFKKFNLNLSVDSITKKFITIGQDTRTLPYRTSLQAFIGIPLLKNNSVALNYIARDNRNKDGESLLSLSYNHYIKNFVNINLSSQVDLNNLERKLVFLNFTKPFPDKSITTSAATNIENNEKTRYLFSLNKNIANYTGFGYHFRASKKHTTDFYGDLKYNSEYNSLQAEYDYISNEHNIRLSARGGIAYLDKSLFFTRTIRDSFVVLDTQSNNSKNLTIYHNNRIITKLNNKGKAIIPQLNSFNINEIHIDPSELAINTKFDKTSFDLIPYRYTGQVINLNLEKNHSVTFKLLDFKKKPIATGAHITDQNNNLLTIVGYDGYVYLNVDNKNIKNKFNIHTTSNDCKFILPIDEITDETIQTDLGEISCG